MLTAADRLDDKASGFELGADDYLTKPFDLRELVLRLRALNRRRAPTGHPCERSQACVWIRSAARSTATAATSRSPGSSSPCSELLVAAEGGSSTAEELLERAWDENAAPVHQRRAHHGLGTAQAPRRTLIIRDGTPASAIASTSHPARDVREGTVGRPPGSSVSPRIHPQLRRLPRGDRFPDARGRVVRRPARAIVRPAAIPTR